MPDMQITLDTTDGPQNNRIMKTICLLLICVGVAHAELTGLGLVVGLSGTGGHKPDRVRKLFPKADPKTCSICIVTAKHPKPGEKLKFNVETMDGALDLKGGVLLPTRLRGMDSKVYAVASGSVGKRKDAGKHHPTSGFGETANWTVRISNWKSSVTKSDKHNIYSLPLLIPNQSSRKESSRKGTPEF